MSSKFKVQSSKFWVLAIFFLQLGCSIPNLASTQCSQASDVVKEFYSYHFGNDKEMGFLRENVAKKDKFFTPEFNKLMSYEFDREDKFVKENPNEVPFMSGDPFTNSSEYPTSFRVGNCRLEEPNRIIVQVLMLWKSENHEEQREMNVEVVKQREKWLINDFVDENKESLRQVFNREKYR